MLDPIVLPLPLALVALIILAVGLAAATYLLRTDEVCNPWADQAWAAAPAPTSGGRHRLATVAKPYRPRDYRTIEAARRDELDAAISDYLESQADTRELAAVQ
jgi:hypothetical protein